MNYTIKNHWLHIVIDDRFNQRTLSEFLDFYHQSRKNRYLLLQNKNLLVNEHCVQLNSILQKGDTLHLFLQNSASLPNIEDRTRIDIAYEDDVVLLVNKPPNLLIHSDGTKEKTLCEQVQHYFHTTGQNCPVHPIHRLDKETSGLVMFCKCLFFQPFLDDQLSKKEIYRTYMAVVEGCLPPHKTIQVEQPIGRDRHNAKKQRVSKNGKPARTTVYCERNMKNLSLVRCSLQTGRTHQIRVHLAYLHHPIVSDALYGKRNPKIQRLALHAMQISWTDPLTFQKRTVQTELPCDIKALI